MKRSLALLGLLGCGGATQPDDGIDHSWTPQGSIVVVTPPTYGGWGGLPYAVSPFKLSDLETYPYIHFSVRVLDTNGQDMRFWGGHHIMFFAVADLVNGESPGIPYAITRQEDGRFVVEWYTFNRAAGKYTIQTGAVPDILQQVLPLVGPVITFEVVP